MTKLIYKIAGFTSVFNPLTKEVEQKETLAEVVITNPTEEQINGAKDIAYNGEFEIVDDGQPEAQPVLEDRVKELEDALTLLLEGATE